MVLGGGGGGKRYVTNVCMYAALFRLYSGIITQTAASAAGKAFPLVHPILGNTVPLGASSTATHPPTRQRGEWGHTYRTMIAVSCTGKKM